MTGALSKQKFKKSPGSDAITNEMIVNLGQPALHKLLDIFNKTCQEVTLPQILREATMSPIHKKRTSKNRSLELHTHYPDKLHSQGTRKN